MAEHAKQVPIVCPGHSRPLTEVNYSGITSDGVFLVSACHDKMPMIRSGSNGDWIGTFAGHKGAVWSTKIDSDGLLVATGAADFSGSLKILLIKCFSRRPPVSSSLTLSAKIWDAITGKELVDFPHKHIVKSVEFSPDRSTLVTGGHEGILRVFDLASSSIKIEIPHDPSEKVTVNKVVFGVEPHIVLTGRNFGVPAPSFVVHRILQ